MSIHNLREKPADAAEAEHQWKGTMIRDGAQRDTVEDRGRRSACVAGGSRSCFTTADRLNLLASFQYLILDLRRSASVRLHDDISPEGQGYNNAFGAFHLPAVTLTDRTLCGLVVF